MSDWWNWAYFCANLWKFWTYDPCLYQFLHRIRGHHYTRRLILRPISAARPRIDLCTKNPPPGALMFNTHAVNVLKQGVKCCNMPHITGSVATLPWDNCNPGGGALNFFQVGVCGPDFWSVALANWYLPLKRGLVNWKFPNSGACELKISKSGACELKISKFGGLWAKIWVKIEAVEAKISKFSQKGVLWTDSFAWNGTLGNYRRGVKGGSSGPHIPILSF